MYFRNSVDAPCAETASTMRPVRNGKHMSRKEVDAPSAMTARILVLCGSANFSIFRQRAKSILPVKISSSIA